MEIREYWRILRRRAWIPIVLLVVSVGTAIALALTHKPQYIAATSVIARNTGSMTFAEVTTSNTVLLQAMHDLNLGGSVDQWRSHIQVTTVRPELYRVSVTDPDPNRAVALANTVSQDAANAYPDLAAGTGAGSTQIDQLLKGGGAFRDRYLAASRALLAFYRDHPDTAGPTPHPKDVNVGATARQLQLEEEAAADAYTKFLGNVAQTQILRVSNARDFAAGVLDVAAARPDTAGRTLQIVYAGALALIVGVGAIFVLEYLDNSVRAPEEVEALVGAPVVGLIPRASPRALRPAKGGAG